MRRETTTQSIIPIAAADTIVYQQNFDSETVNQLPSGWVRVEGSLANYYDVIVTNPTTYMNTKHMAILDAQAGEYTEAYKQLPSEITAGNFEFDAYINHHPSYNLAYTWILQSATGTNLIRVKFQYFAGASIWEVYLDESRCKTYATGSFVHFKIHFEFDTAKLYGNDVLLWAKIKSGNNVGRITLTSGPAGDASKAGEGHFDNLKMTTGEYVSGVFINSANMYGVISDMNIINDGKRALFMGTHAGLGTWFCDFKLIFSEVSGKNGLYLKIDDNCAFKITIYYTDGSKDIYSNVGDGFYYYSLQPNKIVSRVGFYGLYWLIINPSIYIDYCQLV